MSRILVVLSAVLVSAGVVIAAPARDLRIIVYPNVSQAPAVVRVQVLVEPAADNASLEVVADSGGYYRSSTIELPGSEAPRLHFVQFRSLPAGTYTLRVSVLDRRGEPRAMLHHRVLVVE
jgi:hypothetical protein